MSFRHRRNLSLANTTKQRPKSPQQLSRSLRKIPAPNNYYWVLAAAKQHYFKSNDMRAAINSFQQYLTHFPTHLQSLYLCGICYMQLNQYKQAIQKLTQYISLRKVSSNTNRKLIINSNIPNNTKAFLLLSIAYSKLNMLGKSLETINEALSFDSQFQEGYVFRAKLFLKLDEPQKAYYDFRQAIKLNPRCIAAQIGLGDYHSSGNNFGGAFRHYETAKSWLVPQLQEQDNKNDKGIELKEGIKTLNQINLKMSICLYHNGQHEKSIRLLQKCLSSKVAQSLSQIYFYLALNQLKQHSNRQIIGKKSPKINKKQQSQENFLRQAFLNLQCSIKSNSNKKIMEKACKILIKILIQNNQFYETGNVIAMADQYQLHIKKQKELCDSCMLVIKQKYQKAIPILTKMYENIEEKQKKQHKNGKKSERKQQNGKFIKASAKKMKLTRYSQPNTINSMMPKRLRTSVDEQGFESLLSLSVHKKSIKEEDLQENQWMKPVILLFKAYAQYFSDSFIQCLETYELYENYTRDYLGKQPEHDVYLSYNKILCEGLLMLQNQMIDESLQKFNIAIDNYYKFTRGIPAQPILFRIIALLRISLSEEPTLSIQLNSRKKIMEAILQLIDHYMPAVKKNALIFYYMGIVFYDLGRYKEASDAVEHCLKIADECTWKFLYVKGVIEMKRKLFKEAVREFSAGNLVQERADFYLGRCLCYLGLFDETEQQQQAYIEKSFEDLQKFIQLENDKQQISKWVTKILFFNKAYQQVLKSIKKVPDKLLDTNQQLMQIQKCLCVYKGQFEDGGIIGGVIMNAFDGKYEEGFIMIEQEKHEIVFGDFFKQKYKKWLNILNLYSQEKYHELVKYLQLNIFEEKNNEQLIQLRYNLGIVYYLVGEAIKGDNVIAGLKQYSDDLDDRISKCVERKFSKDQCVSDLGEELKMCKKLSSYLSYRKVNLPSKQAQGSEISIFVKISMPFPEFPKPDIILQLSDEFLMGESFQSCIGKKIEAPWIKKVTGQIQFTDNMIESSQTSFMNIEDEKVLQSEPSSDLLEHSSGDDL